MTSTAIANPPDLRDLGRLVTVHYPGRPDLALIAALRLLSLPGAGAGVVVAHGRGALLTRRAVLRLRGAPLPGSVNDGRTLSDAAGGGIALLGPPMPPVLLMDGSCVLDITGSYRVEELDLPRHVLHGATRTPAAGSTHTLVDYPYGLTGVYATGRTTSPLAAALRLMTQLGPLSRRRLEHDLRQLEPSWRQLRNTP